MSTNLKFEPATTNGQRVNNTFLALTAFGLILSSTTGAPAQAAPLPLYGFAQPTGMLSAPVVNLVSLAPQAEQTSAMDLKALRESSGLTWEQLARLFGVSRRSVHNWSAGERMNSHNAEILSQISEFVSSLPGETADEKRSELLRTRPGGSHFDALRRTLSTNGVVINGPAATVLALLDSQES